MTSFLEESPGVRSSSRFINIGAFLVCATLSLWAAFAGEWSTVVALAGIVAGQGALTYGVNRLRG